MSTDSNQPADKLVYANWVRLEATPYDISFDFGYRATEDPPKDYPVHLVMTWEHARDLLTLLDNAVKQYDENVGKIRDLGAEITPARPRPTAPSQRPPQKRKRK